jgi:hypothetical protein
MPSELFHFLDPMRDVADIWPWGTVAGRFSRVAGYTALGDFILIDPRSGEHAILLTMTADLEPTGYTDATKFKRVFLTHPDIVEHVGKPALVAELEERLGALGRDEVYFPVPYPVLGGSGRPETFDKGNVWVFASILGQSHAMNPRPGA